MTAAIPANHQPRIANDAYFTPDALARAIVAELALDLYPASIVEPSVGGGAFARAARALWPRVHLTGVDIDPTSPGFADCDHPIVQDWPIVARPLRDDRGVIVKGGLRADLVLGNPPYSEAEAHVRAALEVAPHVALLLRLGFIAGQKRRTSLWRAHSPSRVYVLPKRPSFKADGKTDATEYALFVWGLEGPTELRWLDWGGA